MDMHRGPSVGSTNARACRRAGVQAFARHCTRYPTIPHGLAVAAGTRYAMRVQQSKPPSSGIGVRCRASFASFPPGITPEMPIPDQSREHPSFEPL
jgi:hypothetical protein